MTDKKQPDALHLAGIADDGAWTFVIGVRKEIAAELRRLHVELETLRAKLKTNASSTPGHTLPPYRVEGFPSGWHCVCNAQGFNCLSFPGQPGVKFTTLERATEICAQWNKAPT